MIGSAVGRSGRQAGTSTEPAVDSLMN